MRLQGGRRASRSPCTAKDIAMMEEMSATERAKAELEKELGIEAVLRVGSNSSVQHASRKSHQRKVEQARAILQAQFGNRLGPLSSAPRPSPDNQPEASNEGLSQEQHAQVLATEAPLTPSVQTLKSYSNPRKHQASTVQQKTAKADAHPPRMFPRLCASLPAANSSANARASVSREAGHPRSVAGGWHQSSGAADCRARGAESPADNVRRVC